MILINQYKNRTLCHNLPVKVYRNLHKKCWSIKQKGLVVAHSDFLYLKNVRMFVNEAGRQLVLRTKKKNVHAYVQGFICDISKTPFRKKFPVKKWWTPIEYNPYKFEKFSHVHSMTGKVTGVDGAAYLALLDKNIYAIELEFINETSNI